MLNLPPKTFGPNKAELHVHDVAANTGDTAQPSRKMPVEHFRKALMATFWNIFFLDSYDSITLLEKQRLKVSYTYGYTRPLHMRRHFS